MQRQTISSEQMAIQIQAVQSALRARTDLWHNLASNLKDSPSHPAAVNATANRPCMTPAGVVRLKFVDAVSVA